jgi:hypothetical protein
MLHLVYILSGLIITLRDIVTTTFSATQTATIQTPSAAKLQPKEHGAYAILGVPLVTALVISGFSFAGICVAIAAVAGFLAHEPLLVVWGHRGMRAKNATPGAMRRLLTLLTITIGSGSVALLLGTTSMVTALFGCGMLAASSFVLAMRGQHRTFGGQLWGVIGLSVPCVPILLSGEVPLAQTLEIWLTWLIGFAATTIAVRAVIAAQKRCSTSLYLVSVLGLSVIVAMLATIQHSWVIAALPMLVISVYLVLQPPPAKQLKRVGWTLVFGTVFTSLWMIVLV